jgi:hypothetical protein
MTIKIAGILIDFPAAQHIYGQAIPAQLQILAAIRADGRLGICDDEEESFCDCPVAAQAFGNADPTLLEMNDQALDWSEKLMIQIPSHRFLGESRCPAHIAAIARAHGFGVITEHQSTHLICVGQCCQMIGVHHWSSEGFFDAYDEIEFI